MVFNILTSFYFSTAAVGMATAAVAAAAAEVAAAEVAAAVAFYKVFYAKRLTGKGKIDDTFMICKFYKIFTKNTRLTKLRILSRNGEVWGVNTLVWVRLQLATTLLHWLIVFLDRVRHWKIILHSYKSIIGYFCDITFLQLISPFEILL